MGCPQNPQIIYQKSSPPKQAEEQCVSSVLDKFRMRYDVPVELSTVGDFSDFPWIKPSDFLRTMARTGDFFRLLGGKNIGEAKSTMKVFWDRYRKIVPHHGIFKSKLAGQLQNCLPLFCHGDEGTGYKKKRCSRGELPIPFWLWRQTCAQSTGSVLPNCFYPHVESPCMFLRFG